MELPSATARAGPTDLPIDLWIQIFASLEPLDILSVRQTCNKLIEPTKERHIWLNTFKNLCSANDLFVGIFRVDNMTQEELEEATVRPLRLGHKLLESSSGFPPSLREFSLPIPKAAQDRRYKSKSDGFESALFLPGGRYLFTRYNELLVDLWDLKGLDHGVVPSAPVASLSPERDELREGCRLLIADAFQHPREDIVYLLILEEFFEYSNTQELHVYAISTTAQRPAFCLLGTRSFGGIFQRAYDGIHLVLSFSTYLEFWNLTTNTTTTHAFPGSVKHSMILAKDGYFIVAHEERRELAVLKIPAPRPSTSVAPGGKNKAVRFTLAPSIPVGDHLRFTINRTVSSGGTGISLSMITAGPSQPTQLDLYTLSGPIPPSSPNVIPSVKPFYSIAIPDSAAPSSGRGFQIGPIYIHPLFEYLLGRVKARFCVTNLTKAQNGIRILSLDGDDFQDFQFCPVSCRSLRVQHGAIIISEYL